MGLEGIHSVYFRVRGVQGVIFGVILFPSEIRYEASLNITIVINSSLLIELLRIDKIKHCKGMHIIFYYCDNFFFPL